MSKSMPHLTTPLMKVKGIANPIFRAVKVVLYLKCFKKHVALFLFIFQMKATVILYFVLLVGVVSGAPAKMKKFQHPLQHANGSVWSRVMKRVHQVGKVSAICSVPPCFCVTGTVCG